MRARLRRGLVGAVCALLGASCSGGLPGLVVAPDGDAGSPSDLDGALPTPLEGGPPSADAAPDAPLPTFTSCADAHTRGISADGEVLIDVDGPGPVAPFSLYCLHMGQGDPNEPNEYLTLKVVVPNDPPTVADGLDGHNVSVWRSGGTCACGSDVVRSFQKVRVLLASAPPYVTLYCDDPTFSIASRAELPCDGDSNCGAFVTPTHNYGVASGCNSDAPFGRGEVDLTGTPFHISSTVIGMGNNGSNVGYTTFSASDRKIATTTSSGGCERQFVGNDSLHIPLELD
jgi:hypothetical protein